MKTSSPPSLWRGRLGLALQALAGKLDPLLDAPSTRPPLPPLTWGLARRWIACPWVVFRAAVWAERLYFARRRPLRPGDLKRGAALARQLSAIAPCELAFWGSPGRAKARERLARWTRDVAAEQWTLEGQASAAKDLGAIAVDIQASLGAKLRGEEMATHWILGFDRANDQLPYARWLHRLWSHTRSADAATRADWVRAIACVGFNFSQLVSMIGKQGEVASEHHEMIRMHGAWGFPDEPLSSADLAFVLDKLCKDTAEAREMREAGPALTWRMACSIHVRHRRDSEVERIREQTGVDLATLLEASLEADSIGAAAAPPLPSQSAPRL